MSTTRRAKLAILMIVVAGFSLGSYPLWTIGVRCSNRGVLKCLVYQHEGRSPVAYWRWNMAVLVFASLVIPGIIIAGITSVIIVILTRAARRRKTLQVDRQVTTV